MNKVFIGLIFLSLLNGSTILLAQDECPVTFSFKSYAIKAKLAKMGSQTIKEDIESDMKEITDAYTCVHDKLVMKRPAPETDKANTLYQKAISSLLAVNKYGSALKLTLEDLKGYIEAYVKTGRSLGRTSSSKDASMIATLLQNQKFLDAIDNSSEVAARLYAKYDAARKAAQDKVKDLPMSEVITDVRDNYLEKNDAFKTYWEDKGKKTNDASLLNKIIKKQDKEIKNKGDVEAAMNTEMVGTYKDPKELQKFEVYLDDKKYALTEPITTSTTTPPSPTTTDTKTADPQEQKISTTTTQPYTPEQIAAQQKALADAAAKQKQQDQMDALTDQLKLIQQKENIPPASTTTTGSQGGGSGAGSVSAQPPQAPDYQREAERKRFIEMAKRREEQSIEGGLKGSLKSGRPSGRLSFLKGLGGGLSLRDFFGGSKKSSMDDSKGSIIKDEKPSKDKDLGFLDDDYKGSSGDDKYKKYYSMGKGPHDMSSKDLFRSQFDSMYESARIKALTEDANTEYAGRYVDIFLLVHSIVEDYYKKGMLVDTTEVIKPVDLRQ